MSKQPNSPNELQKIRTVGDLVQACEARFETIKAWRRANRDLRPPSGIVELWLRGQADAGWDLLPSVERSDVHYCASLIDDKGSSLANERYLNRTFKQLGSGLLPANCDYVTAYIESRHHGFPTRLLDWTTNALVALFLACCEEEHEHVDGKVYLLDPYFPRIRVSSGENPLPENVVGPLSSSSPLVHEAIAALYEDGPVPEVHLAPLPITPPWDRPRVIRQASTFTLHMPGGWPADHAFLTSVVIPASRKVPILRELSVLGVGLFDLFPDLEHLAHSLQEQWTTVEDSRPMLIRRGNRLNPRTRAKPVDPPEGKQ